MPTRQTGNTSAKLLILAIMSATMLLISSLALAADQQPQTITEKMSCATCGMYPYHFPKWHTQVIFTDGSMAAFDGGKCMFRFLLDTPKMNTAHKAGQVAAIWVKDFPSGKWIEGKAAHYVIGSKEMGPMGKELIPFVSLAAAEEFQKANGGFIATYANINMAIIKQLMGGMQMPHSSGH